MIGLHVNPSVFKPVRTKKGTRPKKVPLRQCLPEHAYLFIVGGISRKQRLEGVSSMNVDA